MSEYLMNNGGLAVAVFGKEPPPNFEDIGISWAALKKAKKLGFQDDGRLFELTRFQRWLDEPTETILVNSIIGKMVVYLMQNSTWFKKYEPPHQPKYWQGNSPSESRLIRKEAAARREKQGLVYRWLIDNCKDIFYRYID